MLNILPDPNFTSDLPKGDPPKISVIYHPIVLTTDPRISKTDHDIKKPYNTKNVEESFLLIYKQKVLSYHNNYTSLHQKSARDLRPDSD